MVVPAEQIEPLVAAVMAQARAWTRGLVELPAGEGVELEIVRDEPWIAFCYYLGGLQSRISVNVDLPKSASEILHLTMHETYPGHHAERCVKEQLLVLGDGLLEETIVLVPTPQSIVAEGIAELAPAMVLESGAGRRLLRSSRTPGSSSTWPVRSPSSGPASRCDGPTSTRRSCSTMPGRAKPRRRPTSSAGAS